MPLRAPAPVPATVDSWNFSAPQMSCAKSDWHRDIAKRITQAFKNMHEKKDSASQKVAVKQILWDTTSWQPKINIQ